MNKKVGPNGRRMFIRNLVLMSGAANLMATAVNAMGRDSQRNKEGIPERPCQGYRLTPHIRQYYKTIDP